jgi:hypothetical protein
MFARRTWHIASYNPQEGLILFFRPGAWLVSMDAGSGKFHRVNGTQTEIPSLYWVRGAYRVENILPYYSEDSLSAMFHDLLAELESGCKGDAAFYLSLLRTRPADILELDCGSGRLSLALSKHGHNVEGRVRFTTADMTTFSFPRKFDLIVAPYFALNHLPSENAVLSTFTLVAAHLMPEGYFSLHVADTDRLSRPLELREANCSSK